MREYLELIKLFLEVFILLVWILSGKLIYEIIIYIKESRIKNIKNMLELLWKYDSDIIDLLLCIKNIKDWFSQESLKILFILNSLQEILILERWSTYFKIYNNFLNSIFIKVYLNFLKNNLIKKDWNNIVFSKQLLSNIKLSTWKSDTYNWTLDKFSEYYNYWKKE